VISAPDDGIFLALSRYAGWPMNIRSAKVDQLAQRLARLTKPRWSVPLRNDCPVLLRQRPPTEWLRWIRSSSG
jgi:hypothetical protein